MKGRVMTENEILTEAAEVFRELDKINAEKRRLDERIRCLCRQFDVAGGVWGFQPHHLRRAAEARGILEVAA
jgi:hypothetical protein